MRLALENMQPRLEEEGEDAVRIAVEIPPEDACAHRDVDVGDYRMPQGRRGSAVVE